MAVTGAKYDVDDSVAVQLATGLHHVAVQNLGPNPVYLGGSGVAAAEGFKLPAGTPEVTLPIGLAAFESVYGICDSGQTAEIRVLTYTG